LKSYVFSMRTSTSTGCSPPSNQCGLLGVLFDARTVLGMDPSCDSRPESINTSEFEDHNPWVHASASARCSPRAPKQSMWIAWGLIRCAHGFRDGPFRNGRHTPEREMCPSTISKCFGD
jgi:hypothetical protein